jgi:putative ABC transport system substrate-binding protein
MNRRDTISALLAFGFAPVTVKAQQPAKTTRLAYLGMGRQGDGAHLVEALKQGLRELGYIEGKNVMFEMRWASYNAERLSYLAKELVMLKPDVIAAGSNNPAQALRQATTTIPIVMAAGDPLAAGLVKSLARPGGNITGISNIVTDASPKLLELLLAVLPKLSRVAALWNPSNPASGTALKNIQTAASRLNVKVLPFEAQTPDDIDNAIARMNRENVKAFVVASDALFFSRRHQIAELATKNRMASVSAFRESVEVGGLMSYGSDLSAGARRAAYYVDKILKGAKPGDLPIEQAMTLELVINMKTAAALGITIPQSVLIRADRVIE